MSLKVLIGCLVFCLLGNGPASDEPVVSTPSAGVLVTINPDQLIGVGLVQSWSCVDAPLGNRQISSRPLSRVNVKLKPGLAHNGAALCMLLDGTSAGQSTSQKNANDLVLNTLTRFHSKQHLWIDAGGLAFSEPKIVVQSSQSLHQAKSKNPVAGVLVKSGLKNFSEQIELQAKDFARDQIRKKLIIENANLRRQADLSVDRLMAQYPLLTEFAWQFSSDQRSVYIASQSGSHLSQPIEKPNAAVTVAVHESVIEYFLNRRLANQTFDSQKIAQFHAGWTTRLNLAPVPTQEDQDWSVVLGDQPVILRIEDDGVSIELTMEKIESDERSLIGWALQLHYHWERQGNWNLIRDERVELVQAGHHTDSQGARQQVFRTVMRKRFERMLPEKIVLPKGAGSKLLQELKIDLDVEQIIADNRNLVVAFKRR